MERQKLRPFIVRKGIPLFLVIALCLGLVACKQEPVQQADPTATTATQATTAPTETTAASVQATIMPTEETAEPTEAAASSTAATVKPTEATKAPTKETAKPTQTTRAKPTLVTRKPTAATKAPTPPTAKPTAATEAPTIAGSVYSQAVAAINKAGAVTMDITQKTTTRIGEERFTLTVNQILSYSQLNTDNPLVQMEEIFPDTPTVENYTEYYAQGTVYASGFRGKPAEAARRYVPVGMMDTTQYKEVTFQTEGNATIVRFASPIAGEHWAMPEGAKLVTATGSAKLDKAGKLLEMQYTITYNQGTVETTVETQAKLREEAQAVTLPAQKDTFRELSHIDALRVVSYAQARLQNLPSLTAKITEEKFSSKGRINTTYETYDLCHTEDGKLQYKDTILSGLGASMMQRENSYKNGKLQSKISATNTAAPDPLPETMTDQEAAARFYKKLILPTALPKYWESVTATDLNGVYFLEFTYTDQWAEEHHQSYCDNPQDSYTAKEKTGYFSVDKRTGIVTACGTRSECVHTKKTTVTHRNMALQSPSAAAYEALIGSPPAGKPETLAKPLLYKVTGTAGQEMWLFGTIHIGDDRTAYLPQEVYDALSASTSLALEFDNEKFEKRLQFDSDLAQQVNMAYFAQKQTKEYLDADVYELALKYIKASGNFVDQYGNDVTNMKVALWDNMISNFYLQLSHQYVAEKGVESRLTALAKAYKKPILEVESGLAQIQMLTGWSDDLQDLLLTNTLQTDWETYCQSSAELYELWCAGNEAALRERINRENTLPMLPQSIKEHFKSLLEEYDKGMNKDRNKKMLNTAITYLEGRQKVFFAVGLAHLLDDTSGLVDSLRQAGYTVELVNYS